MANARVLDVSAAIDEAKVSSFTLRVLIVSAFIIFLDGFDINNIGYVAPAMIRAWRLSPAAFGPIFSSSPIGILLGAPVLGYIGDRFGRKKAIFIACLFFSVFTWAGAYATNVTELVWIRFFCGIGIGGVMPNVIALATEYSPRRLRATFVVAMFSGIGLGAGFPGPVGAWLIPKYGWPVLFHVGGVIGILAAVLCLVALPESVKYYMVKEEKRATVASILARIRPDLGITASDELVIRQEKRYSGFSPRQLFQEGYAGVTICLWILFAGNLMGYFFLFNWTPTLLATANIPMGKALLYTSVSQLGGLIGGWTIGRFIDKYGYAPVACLCVLAVPVVGCIGYVAVHASGALIPVMFFAGFSVLGFNYATNGMSGIVYPTAFRSNGSGWCFAVGRAGSVAGPLIGGALIAMRVPVQKLYLFAALPFVICVPVAFIFAGIYRRRYITAQTNAPAQATGAGAR
jgi:AAHS family 4-hydroxybenzoate transporter-like MFS transporter